MRRATSPTHPGASCGNQYRHAGSVTYEEMKRRSGYQPDASRRIVRQPITVTLVA
ncbi:MAG: hypothetical protein IPM07_07860 [Anaerolineales bacterium]|nr:hypothetical protein [Anaerolineales bacterium]